MGHPRVPTYKSLSPIIFSLFFSFSPLSCLNFDFKFLFYREFSTLRKRWLDKEKGKKKKKKRFAQIASSFVTIIVEFALISVIFIDLFLFILYRYLYIDHLTYIHSCVPFFSSLYLKLSECSSYRDC